MTGRIWRRWKYPILMGAIAIVPLRLCLGWALGGTSDQQGYMVLWDLIEKHRNLYTDSDIQVWPPLWWIVLGLWISFWHLLQGLLPSFTSFLGASLFLKILYYVFEIFIALVLARYIVKAGPEEARAAPDHGRFVKLACIFLLLPATWIITSLHGNFDSLPAFFVIFAFLLLQFESSETAALFAAALVGLAAMARTFPFVFAFVAAAHTFRRFRWTTGVLACVLCIAPSFLSLYPLYLMNPAAIMHDLGYRGIGGGWWGLGGLARLLVSDRLSGEAVAFSYRAFYLGLSLLVVWLIRELWLGRSDILHAGLTLVVGLFCLAPTISNQNLYFLIPWAFWCVVVEKQSKARLFLWFVCVDMILIYIVFPQNLEHPAWFQWSFDYAEATRISPIPSPSWLVKALRGIVYLLKRPGLGYNPFIQLLLRMPVWVVLWIWFVSILRQRGSGSSLDPGARIPPSARGADRAGVLQDS